MIATVTLNPAVDRTIVVPGFALSRTNRVCKPSGLSRTETRGLVDEVAALATPAEAVERLRRFALD